MSIALTVVIIFMFLFLLSVAAAVFAIAPLVILQPSRRDREWYRRHTNILEPKDAGLPQEDFEVTTGDGLRLRGWIISQAARGIEPKGTVIFLHGIGDNRNAGLPLAMTLFRQGFSTVLFDSRRHGESEGAFCTYGFNEKHDLVTIINYLESRADLRTGKIGLFGTSMGAAIAIQAAAIEPRIAAVVAEASFTDLRTISVDYQKRLTKLPWKFLRNVAISRTMEYAHFKARFVSPLKDIKRISCPLLFVHGTEDTNVKTEYSRMLFDNAREPKELFLVEGANHTNIMEVGGTLFQDKVAGFFTQTLTH